MARSSEGRAARYLVGAEREQARRLAVGMKRMSLSVDQISEALGRSVPVIKRLLQEDRAGKAQWRERRVGGEVADNEVRAQAVARYREGWTIRRICREYGCWVAEVREWVTDAAVPLRTGESTPEDRARWRVRAVDAYRQCGTVRGAAHATGLSETTVVRLLAEAGARPAPPYLTRRAIAETRPRQDHDGVVGRRGGVDCACRDRVAEHRPS